MKTAHLLLTRMNLGYRQKGHADDWLAYRLDIFERYTLPTVAGQTMRDFRWVLICSADTPPKMRRRIEGYADKCPMIECVWESGEWGRSGTIARGIADEAAKGADWIMTTRVDSDDVLANNFMEHVRAEARGKHCFVVCPDGYVFAPRLGKAWETHQPRNAFFTLCEPAEPGKVITGLAMNHVLSVESYEEKTGRRLPLKLCRAGWPMYVIVRHSKNHLQTDDGQKFGLPLARQVPDFLVTGDPAFKDADWPAPLAEVTG